MDGVFTAAPHHDVLVLLVQVAVLLFTARIMGEIAQRFGQPSVVGEILAGIILGPSLLSGLIPALGEWIVPHNETQGYLLELVSLIGVMFLLLITGLETDLALMRRQARSALGISLGGGLLLPLILGFLLGQLIPESLLVESGDRLVFALFIGTALAIAAIPVVAKVLMDLKLTRRDIGQTIIAAAMIDDTIGWIILSVVIGLASGGAVTAAGVGQSIFTVLAFMVLSLTAGRWLISRLLGFTQRSIMMRDKVLSLVVFLMFVWGAIGQWLGIEALLGAFVVGIVLSQIPQLNPNVIHRLESIALGIFAPIFFAVAGLKVDIRRLLEPELLLVTVAVIVVAIISKTFGVYMGARLIGRADHWTALFYGGGLNARGSIGIIVANIGLSLGILNQDMFSIIAVMAMVTSLMAPGVMKWTIRHIKPQQQEIDRLRREELNQGSLIANVRRVLLPLRVREDSSPSQLIEARMLDQMSSGDGSIALTLMTICSAEDRARSAAFLDRLEAELFTSETVTKKVVVSDRIADAILDEARREYDLMILGASEGGSDSDVVFNPLVDQLVRLAPCPTLLVQGQRTPADWSPNRVLVPSNGSMASRRAAEVAFAIADNGDREVTILQVVEEERSTYVLDASGALLERQKRNAQESVEKLRELGALRGVPATAEVAVGDAPEAVILQTARERSVDLIVLGTNVAVGSERLYLGPRVERILSNAPCPVIVVNA
jgi:Kef-type K+ transport system membrane component KefB/nucleotide-binding universal stress UspA family protein